MEKKKQNGCTKEEKIKEQKEPKARCLERKAAIAAQKAISLGKSVLTGKAQGLFILLKKKKKNSF